MEKQAVFFRIPWGSVEVIVDFDVDGNGHGPAIFLSGIKLPKFYALDGLLIQSHAQRMHHLSIVDASIRTDNHVQPDHALVFRLSRFFGKLRLGLVENSWSGYARFTQVKNSGAYAGAAMSSAYAAAIAAANTGTDSNAVGWRKQLGQRIANLRGL